MPRPWKTPRRRRRRLRRLGIPERVADRPRFELSRAIRTVSLAELNLAENRIGAADIAHETDLRFLETLESFAVQLEADDEILLEDDGVATPADLGIGDPDEVTDEVDLDEMDLDEMDLDEMDLDEMDLDEMDLDPEVPAAAGSAEEVEDLDEDSLDPDTSEILQAVEQTFEELDQVDEKLDQVDEAPAHPSEDFDPTAPDTFADSIEGRSLQSWDGNSLEEYLERSAEMGMASWDGDSLDEYLGPSSESRADPAGPSWDGDSYEEYLVQPPSQPGIEAGEDTPDSDEGDGGVADAAGGIDTWLADGRAERLPADAAHDPLGVGEGFEGEEDHDPGQTEPAAGGAVAPPLLAEHTDELDDLAISLDLEGADGTDGEPAMRGDGGIDPPMIGDLDPTPTVAVPTAGGGVPDLAADSIEVHSENELIVQVGAGLDDAFSAEPLSLVLDGDEELEGELSVGPMDDLTAGLGIPQSASLAALTGGVEPPAAEAPAPATAEPSPGSGDEPGGPKQEKGRGQSG
jgi:hypothetical protein